MNHEHRHGSHGFRRHGVYCDVPRRARLQRRLFWWFCVTILLTGLAVGLVVLVFGPGGSHWREDLARFEELAGAEFSRAWPRPADRHELARNIARAFRADVTLTDENGRIIDQIGAPCENTSYELSVRDGTRVLGYARGCPEPRRHAPWVLLLGLAVATAVLSTASAKIAGRLTRPLAELVRVTQAIGAGDLGARVRLGRHHPGEVGALADSVNEMASRIERQLREERALLAAVSHELRSPLARLRMLVELARGGDTGGERLAEIEAEIVGIDALIGKLLASSRLEFGAVKPQSLPARDVARRALEATGEPLELLDDQTDGARVEVDPTLVGRALGNLLENAAQHAGGVEKLRVVRAEDPRGQALVRFEVLDRGKGFAPEVLTRAFEAFYSAGTAPGDGGSLGLGLALVARIARAHSGRAFAENRAEGGARAVLELPGATAP